MKLLSALTPEGPRLAAKLDGGILIFSEAASLESAQQTSIPVTLHEALTAEGGLEAVLPRLESIARQPGINTLLHPESSVRLGKLFSPGNIICVGLNYQDHAQESNLPLPRQPVLFAKWTGAANGPNDAIVLPPDTNEVDYEAELAVVIGRKCRSVSEGDALDQVAGFTCMNDVSARDFQRGDGQWVRAKSQDTFGPFGPYLVTRDEIPDPQTLPIRCIVNDRVLQDSNTGKMIFSVKQLIAFITRGITLHPGDIITTGTPSGVGFSYKPPVFLRDGDLVSVEIEGIGRLQNPVKAV